MFPDYRERVDIPYPGTDPEGLPICSQCGDTMHVNSEVETKCTSCGLLHRYDPEYDQLMPIF